MIRINNIKKNKRVVLTCMALIILTILCFSMLFLSYAIDNENIDEGDSITVSSTAANELYEQLSSDDLNTFYSFDEQYFNKLMELSQKFSSAVMPVAWLIFQIFIWYTLLQEAKKGEFTIDFFLKFFIKFAVGSFVVLSTDTIFEAILLFGKNLIAWLATAVPINIQQGFFNETITLDTTTASITAHSSYVAQTAVDILGTTLRAAINILNYALLMEFSIRRALAPLATSFVIIEGTRSSGYRYILRTLSIMFKLAIVLIVYKVSIIAAYAIPLNIITYMLFASACTVFIHRDSKLADEVLGIS